MKMWTFEIIELFNLNYILIKRQDDDLVTRDLANYDLS